MIYLLSPYSHDVPGIRHLRYRQTLKYVSECAARGEAVYSPIVHNHHMVEQFHLPMEHDTFIAINETFMRKCDSARVLMLKDWEDSRGITIHELPFLESLDKPVEFVRVEK